jgi:hypothetical protein
MVGSFLAVTFGRVRAVLYSVHPILNRLSMLKIKSILKNSVLNIDRGPSIPNTALAGRKVGRHGDISWLQLVFSI